MPIGSPSEIEAHAARRRKARIALVTLGVIVLVVFGVGLKPSPSSHHTFSSASDYKTSNESGCTNSGPGCHGKETSYADFNKYHPNVKCGVCHDFTGLACIPCHAPNTYHECPLCHDGSMKIAPDRVRITDPFPHGHYRETTHTAVAQDMSEQVGAAPVGASATATAASSPAETKSVAADTGKASAKCSDCHSADLRDAHTNVPVVAGSTYGESIGCGECHNDVRSYGLAEVLAKWKKRDCASCHKVGASAPMHSTKVAPSVSASESAGCANSGSGCHDTNDLHAIHADAPRHCSGSAAKGEPACHTLGTEAELPTAKGCGGTGQDSCHRAGPSGTYQHKHVDTTHSPSNQTAASNRSFYNVPCGSCHLMAANGTSLIDEHALPTSAKTLHPADNCRNCHNNAASTAAVDDKWAAADTPEACAACHGTQGLAAPHSPDIKTNHTSDSPGCASTGAGCHPTDQLWQVGAPTTTANIHSTCLRCHEAQATGGNQSYDPSKKTCGAGRDCHAASGAYSTTTYVHNGSGGLADGTDSSHHTAGTAQYEAVLRDLASGTSTPCGACHDMALGTEHTRPNSDIASAKSVCISCHDTSWSATVVKSSWTQKDSAQACAQCHDSSAAPAVHANLGTSHVGIELGPDGTPSPGACVKSGCHSTTDLRRLHRVSGCTATGCHAPTGDIFGRDTRSCGGANSFTGCHAGYSATNHFVSHEAGIAGTVNGVTYVAGQNVGCFGCHASDLVVEHSRELAAGAIDGGASSSCTICHADPDDPNAGRYAGLSAVQRAISAHDLRCVACHASGSDAASQQAVASPHKKQTAADPLPAGKVWTDPTEEWKAAFNATTGGGHNVLSAGVVGASTSKQFPVTQFDIGGTSYNWVLPPNTGTTAWLLPSAVNGSAESTSAIQHTTIGCDDCHTIPADMVGPHGSAVHVGIDPAYSQTEYADPSPYAYQFTATGTDRVVCFKCHVIPGGAALHSRHVRHDGLPTTDTHHYGEKCVDCHVRIPHAWKRPRLLVRTVVTTDGVAPDTYPYVPNGYNGLQGVVLTSFNTPTDLRSRYCAQGGCHASSHSATRHPLPSDIPTATYWP